MSTDVRFGRQGLTAAECRQLANDYRALAREDGISQKRLTVLTNIANTYIALASQLEILASAER